MLVSDAARYVDLIRTLQKYRGNGNGKVDKLPVLLPFLQI